MGHKCCNRQEVNRGLWSPDEDAKLIRTINTHGHNSWAEVPRRAGLLRCGKSCRFRWINYLRPDLKRGAFSPKEEEKIIDCHRKLGNKWASIAKELPGRTDNEIKNFWNSFIKKKLIARGLDPRKHNLMSPRSNHAGHPESQAYHPQLPQPATSSFGMKDPLLNITSSSSVLTISDQGSSSSGLNFPTQGNSSSVFGWPGQGSSSFEEQLNDFRYQSPAQGYNSIVRKTFFCPPPVNSFSLGVPDKKYMWVGGTSTGMLKDPRQAEMQQTLAILQPLNQQQEKYGMCGGGYDDASFAGSVDLDFTRTAWMSNEMCSNMLSMDLNPWD